MTQDDNEQPANADVVPLRAMIQRQALELQQLMDECNRLRNELRLCNEKNKVAQEKRDVARAAHSQKM